MFYCSLFIPKTSNSSKSQISERCLFHFSDVGCLGKLAVESSLQVYSEISKMECWNLEGAFALHITSLVLRRDGDRVQHAKAHSGFLKSDQRSNKTLLLWY
jgi:hypothetical protein